MSRVDLVVDAGGTGTRLGLARDGELLTTQVGPTCNTRAGGDEALDGLAKMVDQLWSSRPSGVEGIDVACFGLSEASTPRALRDIVRRLGGWFERLGAREAWVVNDIVPLTLGHPSTVVAICGTGTGFAAIGPGGDWARASGLEWLLSDEGGGTEIGMAGLRAVVRAADGRGKPTALSAAAEAWGGAEDVEGLFEGVYRRLEPKVHLAAFAPWVLRAASADDAVAGAIVERAADELAVGVAAVADRAGIPDGGRLRFGGSLLLAEADALRDSFLGRVRSRFAPEPVSTDPLTEVARAAAHAGREPGSLDGIPLAARVDGGGTSE